MVQDDLGARECTDHSRTRALTKLLDLNENEATQHTNLWSLIHTMIQDDIDIYIWLDHMMKER